MTLVSYMTYLDISATHFEWNQYASKLALARLLTLGFVLMLTLAWSFWERFAYSFFLASRPATALVCFPMLFEGNKSKCSKRVFFWLNIQCQLGVSSARRDFIAERFSPLSLLCSAQWSHGSLLCYSCGPAWTRVRSSAYSVNRREAGTQPLRATTVWQQNTLWRQCPRGIRKI